MTLNREIMTTANEEFDDLMPHRIKVTPEVAEGEPEQYDDEGNPINQGVPRIYMCLLDDTTTETRTADGTEVSIVLTAYTAPVPIGSETGEPVDIDENDDIEVTVPYEKKMTINNIERHYDSEDGVGMLHNIVVRFG